MRVTRIQEQIGRGEYHVNTHAVADAIIRRFLGDPRPEPPAEPVQEECS